MRGKRTDTYYVYDAYTDELVGCGSLAKISELFEITPRTLKKYAENGSLYASRNTDNLLKFKRIDGIIEDVEPTIKVASGKIKRSRRLLCNFVEVFDVFKEPKTEEEKEYMRTHFSIIDLNRVYFKLRTAKENEYPFKISFYTNSNSNTLLHEEYYYSKKLAEQRIRYLQEFAAKRELGDFWYNNNYYDDIGRIVYVTRLRNGNNLIQSLDGVQMNNTNRAKYLDLVGFLQHEYIR